MLYIIKKDWFSTGNYVAMFRVVPPVQYGRRKWAKAPNSKEAAVQFGSVPP